MTKRFAGARRVAVGLGVALSLVLPRAVDEQAGTAPREHAGIQAHDPSRTAAPACLSSPSLRLPIGWHGPVRRESP